MRNLWTVGAQYRNMQKPDIVEGSCDEVVFW